MEFRPSAVSFRPEDKPTPEYTDPMPDVKRSSMFRFKKETYIEDRDRVTRSGFKKLAKLVHKIQRRGTNEITNLPPGAVPIQRFRGTKSAFSGLSSTSTTCDDQNSHGYSSQRPDAQRFNLCLSENSDSSAASFSSMLDKDKAKPLSCDVTSEVYPMHGDTNIGHATQGPCSQSCDCSTISLKRFEDFIRLQRFVPRPAALLLSSCDSAPGNPQSDPPSPSAVKEPAPNTPPSRHASLSDFLQQGIKSSLDLYCSSFEPQACDGEADVTVTACEHFCAPSEYLQAIEETRTSEEIVSSTEPEPVETSSSPKSIVSILIADQGPQSPDFRAIFDWNTEPDSYFNFSPTAVDLVRSWIYFCGRMCSPPQYDPSSFMRDFVVAACRSHNLETNAEVGGVPDYLSMWTPGAALISSLLLLAYSATPSG